VQRLQNTIKKLYQKVHQKQLLTTFADGGLIGLLRCNGVLLFFMGFSVDLVIVLALNLCFSIGFLLVSSHFVPFSALNLAFCSVFCWFFGIFA